MLMGCRRRTHRLTTVCMPLLSISTISSLPLRWIRPLNPRLRSGEVRVTTPSGTYIRFRVGDRPFNKQDGDGSKVASGEGRIRIDRHIELPAGLLRVAPLEESVTGVIALPSARFGAEQVTDIRLEFEKGVVTNARARTGNGALQAFLKSDPAASQFRDLPGLQSTAGCAAR